MAPTPGMTGTTLYAHPGHCASEHSEREGWWGRQSEEPHTLLSPAWPCEPSECLQAKEKGLKDTLKLRPSAEQTYVNCA